MFTYTHLFWLGAILFFIASSIRTMSSNVDSLDYLLIVSGVAMFVGSKIGRTFLGLA